MFIISPSADSPEVKELVRLWRSGDPASAFRTVKMGGKDFRIPLLDVVSVCALLVWQPADPSEPVTRLLFPGSAPQHKILEGLEKFKRLEFLKTPVYMAKDSAPAATPSSTSSATAFAKSPVKTKSTTSPRHTAEPVAVKAVASRKVEASKPSKAADTNKEAEKATPRPAAAKIKAEVLSSSSRAGSTELRAKKAEGAKPTPLIKTTASTKKDPTLSNGDANKTAPQPKLKKDVANMKMVEARVHSFKSPVSLKRAEENNKNKKPDELIKDKVQRSLSQSREKRSASSVRGAPEEKVKLVKKVASTESPASPAKAPPKPIKAKPVKETKTAEPKVVASKEIKKTAAPPKPKAKEAPKPPPTSAKSSSSSSTPSAKAVKRPVKAAAAATAAVAAVAAVAVVADTVADQAPVEEEAFNAAEAPQAASSPKHAEGPSDEPIADESAILDAIESQIVEAAAEESGEHQTEEEPPQPEELENEAEEEAVEVGDQEEAESAEVEEEEEEEEEEAAEQEEIVEPEEAGDEVAESAEEMEAADTAGLEEAAETEDAEVAVTDEADVVEETAVEGEEEANEKADDEEETTEPEEQEATKEQEVDAEEEEQVHDDDAVAQEETAHEPEDEEEVVQVEQEADECREEEEKEQEVHECEEEEEKEAEEEMQAAFSSASVEASRQPDENVEQDDGHEAEEEEKEEDSAHSQIQETERQEDEDNQINTLPEAISCQLFGNGHDATLDQAQDDATSGQTEEEEEVVAREGQVILLFDGVKVDAQEDQQTADEVATGHQEEVLSSLSSLSEQEQESAHDCSAPSPYDEDQQPSSMESQPESHQFTQKIAPTQSEAPKVEDLSSGSFSAAVEEEEFKAEIVHRPVLPVADPSDMAGIVTPEPIPQQPSVAKSPAKEIPAAQVLEDEDDGEEVEEEAFHQEIKTSKEHAVPITPTEEQAPAAFGFEPERRNEDPQLPSSQSDTNKEDSYDAVDAAPSSRSKEAQADEFRATIDVQYAGFMDDKCSAKSDEKKTPVVEQKQSDVVKEDKKTEESHQEQVASKVETKAVEVEQVAVKSESKPVESHKIEETAIKSDTDKEVEEIVEKCESKPVECQKVGEIVVTKPVEDISEMISEILSKAADISSKEDAHVTPETAASDSVVESCKVVESTESAKSLEISVVEEVQVSKMESVESAKKVEAEGDREEVSKNEEPFLQKEVEESKKVIEEPLMQTLKDTIEAQVEPVKEESVLQTIKDVVQIAADKKEESKKELVDEVQSGKTQTDVAQESPKENKPVQMVPEPLLVVEEVSKTDIKPVQSEKQEMTQSNKKDVIEELVTMSDVKEETVSPRVEDSPVNKSDAKEEETKQHVKEEALEVVETPATKKEDVPSKESQPATPEQDSAVEAKKPSILQGFISDVVDKIQDVIKPSEKKELEEPKVQEETKASPVETAPHVKETEELVLAEEVPKSEALPTSPKSMEPEPVLFEKCEKYGKFETEKVSPLPEPIAVESNLDSLIAQVETAVDRKLSDSSPSEKEELMVESPILQTEIKSVSASPMSELTKEDIPVRSTFVAPITASSPIDGPEILKEAAFSPALKKEDTACAQTKVDELLAKLPADNSSPLEFEQSTAKVSELLAKSPEVVAAFTSSETSVSPKTEETSLSRTPEVSPVLSKLSPLESKVEVKTPEPLEIDPPATFQFKCDPLANLPAVDLVQSSIKSVEHAAPKTIEIPKEETKEKTDQLKPDIIDYSNVSGSSSASVTPKSPLSPNIGRRQITEPEITTEFVASTPPPTRFEDETKSISQPSSLDSVGVHSTTSSASWAGAEEKHEEEQEEEEAATLSSTPTASYLSGYEGVTVAAASKLSTIASSDGESEGVQPPSLDSNWSSKTFDKLTAADNTARLHPEESAFSSGPSSWDDREPMARPYFMVSETASDRSATSSIMSHITDDEYPVKQLDHPSLVGHDEPHVTETSKQELDVAPVSPVPSSPFSTDRSSSHGDFEGNKDSLSSIQTSASSDYHLGLETKVDDSASAVSSTRSDYSDRSGSSVDPLHQQQQLEPRSLTPRSDISSTSETTATITTNTTTPLITQPAQQTATEVKASKAELADPKLAPHNIWLKEKDTASSPNPFSDQYDDVDHPESLEHASSAIYYQPQQQQQHLSDVESDRHSDSQSSVQVAEYTDEYYAQHLAFTESSQKSPHARDEASDQEAYLYESEHEEHDQQYHPYSTKYSDSYDEGDLYQTEEAINDDYRQQHHEIGDHQNGNSYSYYEGTESSTAGMNLGHLQHDQNVEAYEDMNRNDRTPSRDTQQHPYVVADVYETEPAFHPTRQLVSSITIFEDFCSLLINFTF